MELNRLFRVVLDRWWVVLLFAVLGMTAAIAFTLRSNQAQGDLFEATAGIRFQPEDGETIADLGDEISEAAGVATIAAGDLLAEDATSLIVADPATARLLFIATGSSPDEAGGKAQAMMQAYFDIDPTIGGSVDDLLAQLEAEAIILDEQIATLNGEPTREEASLALDHQVVDQKIAAVSGRLVALAVADASADQEMLQANARERNLLENALEALLIEKNNLEPLSTTQLTVREQLELNTLQRRLDLLALEYERLFLRKLGVTGLGTAEPTTFVDRSPDPADPVVNAGIGLIGGLMVAIFGLVVVTRASKPVWLAEDLPIPVLGHLPARKSGSLAADTWYDDDSGGPRKAAIQQLRSTVEARLPASGGALAITGHNIGSQGSQTVVLDLGASMASAGASVLLVDADFGGDVALGSYRADSGSLSEALALNPHSLGFASGIESVVDKSQLLRPGLAVVPAGPPPSSPADALAGRPFRVFLEKALEQFDFVLVAVGDIESPAGQVAMQRLRRTILVLTPGRSTAPRVNGSIVNLANSGVSMVGAVFLDKRERSVRGSSRPVASAVPPVVPAAATETTATESPLQRLSHYPSATPESPEPGQAPAVEPPPTMPEIADIGAMGAAQAGDRSGLGSELLNALDEADDSGYDAVADYLVTRLEDMLGSAPGTSTYTGPRIAQVEVDGFVPLRPLKGRSTAGALIEAEIMSEMKARTAKAIVDEMEQILAKKVGRAVYLDEWLSDQFFKRHIARSGGEPYIWDLASTGGTIRLLLPANRFDQELVAHLSTQVVADVVDELERFQTASVVRGDLEQAKTFEARVIEAKHFQTALRQLTDDGGAVFDESDSLRARIAPLQRVGLLPFHVLAETEVNALLATS